MLIHTNTRKYVPILKEEFERAKTTWTNQGGAPNVMEMALSGKATLYASIAAGPKKKFGGTHIRQR